MVMDVAVFDGGGWEVAVGRGREDVRGDVVWNDVGRKFESPHLTGEVNNAVQTEMSVLGIIRLARIGFDHGGQHVP
jgi:hypothetical protein